MLWWILYIYLSLQVFIAAGILLLLVRAKLKASESVGNARSAPMQREDQQQAYQ
ncbi:MULTISPECIES: hypothetical protein [unclassified Rhizobium]|jgi:hypothetical protein|uniref:hypothetical protein n=1 Tax=unclassified Rhizobium TaxID=2613769 RepID=UPI00037FBB27|nr:MULTISPECIES: hypothetical protein [unclassified Rhizobium]MBB3447199.1 hypothetical protein [Rhizobium sp. BK379]MBB3565805.1 hypothetical protein [Rhizobium sp. BK512]